MSDQREGIFVSFRSAICQLQDERDALRAKLDEKAVPWVTTDDTGRAVRMERASLAPKNSGRVLYRAVPLDPEGGQ